MIQETGGDGCDEQVFSTKVKIQYLSPYQELVDHKNK